MGLLPSDSLEDIIYFENVVTDEDLILEGKFRGDKKTYTVAEFLSEHGERIPNYLNSQKEFRILCIVLTSEDLTETQWNTIYSQVEWFTATESTRATTRRYNFWEATRGLASLDAKGLYTSLIGTRSGARKGSR